MYYAIQVNTSPYASKGGLSAYRFAEAALSKSHDVIQVFFYQEGIYHALRYALPPDDELNLTRAWSELAYKRGVDLAVCISAAQRRGLLGVDEARRQGVTDPMLADGFRVVGLGQWLDATQKADRFMVFV
ncbi:MAG: sulfurtransferase complex subunit TusD [Methylomonas sp.]|nr:sulfurtransferase complex subunit TusD [Methylomonas sp.]PPD22071.1 MAG: sulfurtransferase complex subunit TusD [Methylomonas sp.]PPD26149.1 MAG: sulfurtransferase complex subunit TusD [Methylomonas sp.]PPD37864.1 MAG: sulfurtransferase complex subunit TusD [Methylomonas sp.]PPD42441.1 MAG: sulfurtransferase complex subunit TusD [Methylomonas sp.]